VVVVALSSLVAPFRGGVIYSFAHARALIPARAGFRNLLAEAESEHGKPEGFQNLGSCCGAVFVDEAAEEVVAFDRPGAWWIGSIDRFGRLKAACSMRASAVVVSRVGAEHVLEMSAADDQQPVETLGADGADEALGVGVCLWRTDRRMDHIDAFAAEDLVEGCTELAVPVMDQEARPLKGCR
jgi:hypothetical protein